MRSDRNERMTFAEFLEAVRRVWLVVVVVVVVLPLFLFLALSCVDRDGSVCTVRAQLCRVADWRDLDGSTSLHQKLPFVLTAVCAKRGTGDSKGDGAQRMVRARTAVRPRIAYKVLPLSSCQTKKVHQVMMMTGSPHPQHPALPLPVLGAAVEAAAEAAAMGAPVEVIPTQPARATATPTVCPKKMFTQFAMWVSCRQGLHLKFDDRTNTDSSAGADNTDIGARFISAAQPSLK